MFPLPAETTERRAALHGADLLSAAAVQMHDKLMTKMYNEAAPERQTPRAAPTAAEPVTSRLLERISALPAPQPEAKTPVPVTVAAPEPVLVPVAPFRASQPSLFAAPLPRSGKPKPSHRQRVSREEQAKAVGQLSLF